MNCTREPELLETIEAGRWPEACGDDLRTHVASCTDCNELALVAHDLLTDANATMREAALPSSGAMWWRLQRRAHADAMRKASRTIAAVQIGSVIAFALIAILFFGGFTAIEHALHGVTLPVSLPLIVTAIAACVTLAPAAVYYAITEE